MSESEEAKAPVAALALAYKRVFNPENADVKLVVKDLARLCRALESTFHPDARVAAQLDGRREVFLHIQKQCKLTTDELWVLLGATAARLSQPGRS